MERAWVALLVITIIMSNRISAGLRYPFCRPPPQKMKQMMKQQLVDRLRRSPPKPQLTVFSRRKVLRKAASQVPTKVVTDIDDTVVSSGGLRLFGVPLGIDTLYKRGQFYPGVIQFGLELSSDVRGKAASKVSLLTARASELRFALRPSKVCSAYSALGAHHGLDWGIGDVYYGSIMEWLFQGRKGVRKAANFASLLSKDRREQQYVLIGDTGEKDEEAAERVAAAHPGRIRAVFLRVVYPHSQPRPLPVDRRARGAGIFYFRTYVGAAVKAFEQRMLDRQAVLRVARAAVLELRAMDQVLAASKQARLLAKVPGQRLYAQMLAKQAQRWEELRQDGAGCDFLRDVLSGAEVLPASDSDGVSMVN